MAFVPTASHNPRPRSSQPRPPTSRPSSPWTAARTLALAATIAAATLLPTSRSFAETISGPARIVDGDTLVISSRRVRLYAMDAPELAQRCMDTGNVPRECGREAADRLKELVEAGGGEVSCEGKRQDMYGRLVAVCRVRGEDVGERLVSEGYAVAYRQYGKKYVEAEAGAKEAKRGVWATEFQIPADFRREQRAQRQQRRM